MYITINHYLCMLKIMLERNYCKFFRLEKKNLPLGSKVMHILTHKNMQKIASQQRNLPRTKG